MAMSKKSVQKKISPSCKEYLVGSLNGWEKVARDLVRQLRPGDIITLSGPLGAGKTTFVQALARVLGAKRQPKSPTFSLVRTYKLKTPSSKLRALVHVDAYRIERAEDVVTLGLDELLETPETVMALEWPENMTAWLRRSKRTISVTIKFQKDGTRIVRLQVPVR
jgi:tRNA threonylcarbamoyladenosine biosynthesis protein TsaE